MPTWWISQGHLRGVYKLPAVVRRLSQPRGFLDEVAIIPHIIDAGERVDWATNNSRYLSSVSTSSRIHTRIIERVKTDQMIAHLIRRIA